MKQKRCAFHQNQYLVNFCRNSQCLLPMCPVCVKYHSAEHVRLNTHGFYDCISDMHKQVATTLQNTLKSIICSGNQLKQIYQYRQNEKNVLMEKLKQMRLKIIETINKYIDGLQQDVYNQVSSLQSQYVQQFSQIDSKIQKIASQAQNQTQSLNNQKSCIKAIINHISSNMPAYYNYQINQISYKINYLKTHQINIDKQFKSHQMNDILKFVGQNYHLTFIQPIKRRQMKKIPFNQSNSSKFSQLISTQGSNKKVL